MKARTTWFDTLTHHQSQFPDARECGHGTMSMISHPQGLPTLLTILLKRVSCVASGRGVRRAMIILLLV